MLPQSPGQACHISSLQGHRELMLPWIRPGSLQGTENITLQKAHHNRARCKHAMKDEWVINTWRILVKPLTVSVTDLDGVGDSVKYAEKSLASTVLSHSCWSYPENKSTWWGQGFPSIGPAAIKELKNGSVIRQRLKVGGSVVQSLYIILLGYTKITLMLSTAVNKQPVSFRYSFFHGSNIHSWCLSSQTVKSLP